jgi:hypothetical protein
MINVFAQSLNPTVQIDGSCKNFELLIKPNLKFLKS